MKKILVVGGAGYIGSHTVIALANSGYMPVILDNFSNSEHFIIDRLEKLTKKKLRCYEQDYRETDKLNNVIKKEKINGIIHFAALKAVGESVKDPIKYYDNNVSGFISLLKTALDNKIYNLVFSSSAAVYGIPKNIAVTEQDDCKPSSPYGMSKLIDELILKDTCLANHQLNGIALRYFNVIGADPSGLIGELAKGKPNNLLPILIQSIANSSTLIIFGNDYSTPDGTCLRDYVHVSDLANAHVKALDLCFRRNGGYEVFNIGTGRPTSTLELIKIFEEVNKIRVPYKIGKRRPGDPPAYYASNSKALKELDWTPMLEINKSVEDVWRWYKNNQ